MITAILPVEYASAHITDPWWVRFAQDGISDSATVGETADLLDTLYSIDPCDEKESDPTTPTADDLTTVVVQTWRLSICDKRYDGSVLVPIKMYRSHPRDAYVLRVSGGRVEGEIVTVMEEVVQTVSVETATSVTLEYPVISDFTVRWFGTVIDADGRAVAGPAIQRMGNTLYWTEQVTGTLQAEFVSAHEQVGILVAGVNGEMGESVVRAFYHGACTTFTPQMPDVAESDTSLCPSISWKADPTPDRVTCYKQVTAHRLCSCSKIEVSTHTYEKIVPCPESGPTRCSGNSSDCMHLLGSEAETEYVDCDDDQGYLVADRDYYKKTCCEDPAVTLPRCREHIESYRGDQPIEHGEEFWRALYGPATRFIPVSPEKGCGKHITRQVVEAEDCCAQIPLLDFDWTVSARVIVDHGVMAVKGGKGPFRWSLEGQFFSFSPTTSKSSMISDGPMVNIFLEDYACGTCQITCRDECDQVVVGAVRSTDGHWRDLTDEELCEFPRDSMYAPDTIFAAEHVGGVLVDPAADTLPAHLLPTQYTREVGVAFKELGSHRIYVWFLAEWKYSEVNSIAGVDAIFDLTNEGAGEWLQSTIWCAGDDGPIPVRYIDIYGHSIFDPERIAVEASIMGNPEIAHDAKIEWMREPAGQHKWYALNIPFTVEPYMRAAGIRIYNNAYTQGPPHPRVYTWSCA